MTKYREIIRLSGHGLSQQSVSIHKELLTKRYRKYIWILGIAKIYAYPVLLNRSTFELFAQRSR